MKKPTPTAVLHMVRLLYRSLLFLAALAFYLSYRAGNGALVLSCVEDSAVLNVIWWVFAVEMLLRFFPSRLESPGCQKQFAGSFLPTGKDLVVIHDNNATMLVALIWACFNGVFGALHMSGLLDDGIMILLCCAYSVCDIICILFFCPFQTWFLKNKCCCSCRIYNWDYAMMFTPLFFIRNRYAWSLLAMAVVLLIRWEITFYLHPERFSDETNAYLHCENCTEKLCLYKQQLKKLQLLNRRAGLR